MPIKQSSKPIRHVPAVDPLRVPGKFVVEFGRAHPPKLEFYADADSVTRRLEWLWNHGDSAAQARTTTWHDVVRYHQLRL